MFRKALLLCFLLHGSAAVGMAAVTETEVRELLGPPVKLKQLRARSVQEWQRWLAEYRENL